jgi:hypothetical protein
VPSSNHDWECGESSESQNKIWWWENLDQILPELLPWERGLLYSKNIEMPQSVKLRLEQISGRRQKEHLEKTPYADLNFEEVIRRHFADFLDPTATTEESNQNLPALDTSRSTRNSEGNLDENRYVEL